MAATVACLPFDIVQKFGLEPREMENLLMLWRLLGPCDNVVLLQTHRQNQVMTWARFYTQGRGRDVFQEHLLTPQMDDDP